METGDTISDKYKFIQISRITCCSSHMRVESLHPALLLQAYPKFLMFLIPKSELSTQPICRNICPTEHSGTRGK